MQKISIEGSRSSNEMISELIAEVRKFSLEQSDSLTEKQAYAARKQLIVQMIVRTEDQTRQLISWIEEGQFDQLQAYVDQRFPEEKYVSLRELVVNRFLKVARRDAVEESEDYKAGRLATGPFDLDLLEALGLCSSDILDWSLEDIGFTIKFNTWICTDTEVGFLCHYVDRNLVAVSFQRARKADKEFYWVSRDAALTVKHRIQEFMEPETFPVIGDDLFISEAWLSRS